LNNFVSSDAKSGGGVHIDLKKFKTQGDAAANRFSTYTRKDSNDIDEEGSENHDDYEDDFESLSKS